MHGRLKVKSTAQQEAERKAAQQKKLKIYEEVSADILSRRGLRRYDTDTLKLIADILMKNPDVTVLWNYRREILVKLSGEMSEDEFQSLVDSELDFVAGCLTVNPKSYYAWHQRGWVLLIAPRPNWERELKLCGQFLQKDERNFHCWDYRRWLVNQAGISHSKELDFVTNKLYENFSNFSAWHYRSRLIPKVYAAAKEADNQTVPQQVLADECDLVRNALYVDPTDQSPWFYHRWLLAQCTQRRVFMHCAVFDPKDNALTIAFSKPVTARQLEEIGMSLVAADPDSMHNCNHLRWTPVRRGNASSLWSTTVPVDAAGDFQWTSIRLSLDGQTLNCSVNDSLSIGLTKAEPTSFFIEPIDARVRSLIETELASIRELHTMEPDSKWVLLELTAMQRIMSPLQSEQEVLALIDKLVEVDTLRERYYKDMKSRYIVENRIMSLFSAEQTRLSCAGLGLTRLTCVGWLAALKELDLSDNALQTLPDDFQYLVCLEQLRIDRNKLTSLESVQYLPRLAVVSARSNHLTKVRDIRGPFTCPAIRTVDVRENAIPNNQELQTIAEEFSNVTFQF